MSADVIEAQRQQEDARELDALRDLRALVMRTYVRSEAAERLSRGAWLLVVEQAQRALRRKS